LQGCDVCQITLGEHVLSPDLTMNFICEISRSERKNVIMVIIDKLIKYYHLIALFHPFKATTIADQFLNTVYKLHDLPIKIIIDRDPIFATVFWNELMGRLEIKLNVNNSYHPKRMGNLRESTNVLNHI
jgi:hypothetical protein